MRLKTRVRKKMPMHLMWLMLLLFGQSQVTLSGTISGNIVFPTPYSQTGNIALILRISSLNSTHSAQQSLVVNDTDAVAGHTVPFSLTTLNGENYVLQYSCNSFTHLEPCKNIVQKAYYDDASGGQAILRMEEAQVIAGTTGASGLNFPLLTGNIITGTMSLPSGMPPAGGLKYQILASTVTAPTARLFVGSNVIADTASAGTFQIMIPNDVGESWILEHSCTTAGAACDSYLPIAYYQSTAANTTVDDIANAQALPGDSDSTNKNMTFLTGPVISGNVIVPSAVTSMAGIRVRVIIQNEMNLADTFENSVVIAQGQTTEPYSLTVLQDSGINWLVRYDCDTSATPDECNKYLTQGYYSNSGTQELRSNADTLLGGESHMDKHLTLLNAFSISGSLKLSAGLAPAGGITVIVNATETSGIGGNFNDMVLIPEGAAGAAFQINIDSNVNRLLRLSYDCSETISPICNKLTDQGFYNHADGTTVSLPEDATPIPGGLDTSGIILTVGSDVLADDMCLPIKTGAGLAVVCL